MQTHAGDSPAQVDDPAHGDCGHPVCPHHAKWSSSRDDADGGHPRDQVRRRAIEDADADGVCSPRWFTACPYWFASDAPGLGRTRGFDRIATRIFRRDPGWPAVAHRHDRRHSSAGLASPPGPKTRITLVVICSTLPESLRRPVFRRRTTGSPDRGLQNSSFVGMSIRDLNASQLLNRRPCPSCSSTSSAAQRIDPVLAAGDSLVVRGSR